VFLPCCLLSKREMLLIRCARPEVNQNAVKQTPNTAEELAAFVVNSSYEDLSCANCDQLKIRIVDALACAFGAMDSETLRPISATS